MRKSELNKLSKDELNTKLIDNQEALVNLRFQKASGQLEKTSQIKKLRKKIAQLCTKINQNNKLENA